MSRPQPVGSKPDATGRSRITQPAVTTMLYFAAAFLVIALLAAALGFGGIAGSATFIAQILSLVFLGLAGLSLLLRETRRDVS